jgi:transcriptional regulator with XRE-family HTH domain
MSQQKLADSLGTVSKSSINMYERGDREPGLETMEAFADFFNVDLDFLYGKSDVPNRTLAQVQSVSPCWDNSSFELTPHEKNVIVAYRANPVMQPAVDRLLGVEDAAAQEKQA